MGLGWSGVTKMYYLRHVKSEGLEKPIKYGCLTTSALIYLRSECVSPVLDFTHAHLHKCMHFFLCASKFSNLHAHCACNFLVTNFKMNRNSKKLLISTNFQGIKSLCFLYFAICVVFSLLRPSFVHVPTMLCK